MSPVMVISFSCVLSFPRVSGDEPSQPVALLGEAPFSPRERG